MKDKEVSPDKWTDDSSTTTPSGSTFTYVVTDSNSGEVHVSRGDVVKKIRVRVFSKDRAKKIASVNDSLVGSRD